MLISFILLTILLLTSSIARPPETREVHAIILPSPSLHVPSKSLDIKIETPTSINRVHKRNSPSRQSKTKRNRSGTYEDFKKIQETRVDRNSKKEKKQPKVWDHWGKWSSCSVTCGIGKMTRWRHCVSGGCASGEKEAQIRTCTNPAC